MFLFYFPSIPSTHSQDYFFLLPTFPYYVSLGDFFSFSLSCLLYSWSYFISTSYYHPLGYLPLCLAFPHYHYSDLKLFFSLSCFHSPKDIFCPIPMDKVFLLTPDNRELLSLSLSPLLHVLIPSSSPSPLPQHSLYFPPLPIIPSPVSPPLPFIPYVPHAYFFHSLFLNAVILLSFPFLFLSRKSCHTISVINTSIMQINHVRNCTHCPSCIKYSALLTCLIIITLFLGWGCKYIFSFSISIENTSQILLTVFNYYIYKC